MQGIITTVEAARSEIENAHMENRRPDLEGAVLQGVNLSGLDLRGADLRGAILRYSILCGVNLEGADLEGADLRNTNLRRAILRRAFLRRADLRYSRLRGAVFVDADLWRANLLGAYLKGADFRGVTDGILYVSGLPSGDLYMVPTTDGWDIMVGCWPDYKHAATLDDLVTLLDAPDDEWPEARGDERMRREPSLRAAHSLCVAHADYHSHIIGELVETWSATAELN